VSVLKAILAGELEGEANELMINFRVAMSDSSWLTTVNVDNALSVTFGKGVGAFLPLQNRLSGNQYHRFYFSVVPLCRPLLHYLTQGGSGHHPTPKSH